jgi:hypothetical protein
MIDTRALRVSLAFQSLARIDTQLFRTKRRVHRPSQCITDFSFNSNAWDLRVALSPDGTTVVLAYGERLIFKFRRTLCRTPRKPAHCPRNEDAAARNHSGTTDQTGAVNGALWFFFFQSTAEKPATKPGIGELFGSQPAANAQFSASS